MRKTGPLAESHANRFFYASHPPVWIHRKCESRSLKKTLNSLCLDDDYTIAQWLEHRWLQARVPGSSPGGDSQFFLQTFPVCLFPSNQLILLLLLLLLTFILLGCFPQTYGLLTGAPRMTWLNYYAIRFVADVISACRALAAQVRVQRRTQRHFTFFKAFV